MKPTLRLHEANLETSMIVIRADASIQMGSTPCYALREQGVVEPLV